MKSSYMNTHMGNISIDNEVIAQYAGSVANECFGIVGMAGVNVKEGIVNLLKKDTMTRGIDVTLTPRNRLLLYLLDQLLLSFLFDLSFDTSFQIIVILPSSFDIFLLILPFS